MFDLSPFVVKVDNDRVPLTHFLTNICAIVGGVVSVRPASVNHSAVCLHVFM